jgi:hypothetical protein
MIKFFFSKLRPEILCTWAECINPLSEYKTERDQKTMSMQPCWFNSLDVFGLGGHPMLDEVMHREFIP